MIRLAIVTTHPIQYNAPWFRLLAGSSRILPRIFYTWQQTLDGPKFDPGFGKKIEWDIPLLDGYDYTFVKNTATDPGTHHFKGIVNPTLNKEIEAWKPDALLIYGWSFSSHLACMRFFHGRIPVLFRGDSTLLDEQGGLKKWIRRLFLKRVYRKIDYALYVGSNNKDYFLACGLKEDQLVLMPHVVDNDRFAQPDEWYQQKATVLRNELGIGKEDLVLLFAGKLEKKKNPFFLLQLAGKIKDQRIKFIIAGNGNLEKELKETAASDKRILFMDFQNQQQMPVLYRLGDFFILPSAGPGETWGLAINEAMASGCAIITSNKAGGAIDLVREDENGLVIDLEDPEKCLQLIRISLQDRARVEEMKKTSRRLIAYHSLQGNVQIMETFLDKTIA